MKEIMLNRVSRWLVRKTEDAYLAGDNRTALYWSQRLDKVVYQLMLIKNHDVLESLRSGK